MLSQQEISDRLEIQELMVRYSHAVDSRNWDLLDEVFTPDAVIDYTVFGGPRGSLGEIKEFLGSAMPTFIAFQHMIANSMLEIDGDTATGRTMCHNPMVLPPDDEGGERVFFVGLWYLDRFVRAADGWRIAERVEEKSYTFNMPAEMQT